MGASAVSRRECPPYATSAAMRLARTVSTLRSVRVLMVMPSTRFSRSRAGRPPFSSRVRQVAAPDPRRHQPAAFRSNLQPPQHFSSVADGIVSAVQTVEPARMIFLVKALRTQEQVQVSEGTLNFDGFVVRGARWDS